MNIKNGVARVNLNVEKPALAGAGGRENLPPASAGRPVRTGRWWLALAVVGTILGSSTAFSYTTNTVEKVADLGFYLDGEGAEQGGYAPLDRFTQVGTNLWFTTSKGGAYDVGTISQFTLTSHQVIQVAALDNNSGSKPESPLTVIGDNAYFTTTSTGVSNKGTIAEISLTDGTVTPLFAFPNNGLPTGATPRAGVTQIGDNLWTLTSLGGVSNRGVVLEYSLASGLATLVTNLDGPNVGGQAFDGFTQAGNAWYFLTFSGGNTFNTTNYLTNSQLDGSIAIITNKLSLGAGTLGRLTFDNSGNPLVSQVLSLQGGFDEFPAVAPLLVGTNSLYFTSTGPNTQPGALLRYDLDTGHLAELFTFSTNPISTQQYGTRPGYSGLTEWLGELYFINRNGGTNSTGANSGGGTVAKFNIASNTVIKLADLGNTNLASDLGSPSGFFGAGTVVLETNRFYIYYPLTSGGANGLGSIIRVALPPLAIKPSLAITNSGASLVLSWSGGYPPFDVLTNGDLSQAVTNWAVAVTNLTSDTSTTNWSVTLPASNTGLFYSIRGQAQ